MVGLDHEIISTVKFSQSMGSSLFIAYNERLSSARKSMLHF